MASWKSLAKAALLSDGRIDTKETELIRAELFADDRIDKSELEFMQDLRNSAESTVKAFTTLFVDAVKSHVLEDGSIDAAEAKWLRKALYADGEIDADEIQLLKDIKADASSTCPEFDELYTECVTD